MMRTYLATLAFAALVVAIPGWVRAQASSKLSPALKGVLDRVDPSKPVATWVYFADKGDHLAVQLRDAEKQLTPHARARRARNRGANNLVDMYDIPVRQTYVDGVRRHTLRIRHTSRWLNAVSVDLDRGALNAMAALPFVQRMDIVRSSQSPVPEPVVEAPPPHPQRAPSAYALDYGASLTQNSLMNVTPLHDQGYSGAGVWICMMDSGCNTESHVAFQNFNVLITHDFVNGDSIVADQIGQMGDDNHGTQTASTIGGYVAGELIGPAFGATYILAKTENTTWERHVEEDAWVAAAEWADSIGADIITSSVGYSTGFTNGEASYTWSDMDGNTTIVVIGADIAASRGILVVNSAGNGGSVAEPANTLLSPADGDSVLAVGAVDATGARAGFSSVGPTADARIKPDVMAMGSGVRAVSTVNPTGYAIVGGTSFSCPLVAGAAALIMEARPSVTNASIMDALRQTASQSSSPDRLNGWGIIDATAAVSSIATGIADPPRPNSIVLHPAYPNPFNPTTTIEYEIATSAHVSLTVFDVRGAFIAALVDGVQTPGRKWVTWHATDRRGAPLASGVYVCRLDVDGVQLSRKLVLLK